MRYLRLLSLIVAGVVLAANCDAADMPAMVTAHGLVEKADKGSLTIRPRSADGKFGKNLVLQVTGTSKIAMLIPRTTSGKTVFTQKDTDVSDLKVNQPIAVIYTEGANAVLLTAVVQPAGDK